MGVLPAEGVDAAAGEGEEGAEAVERGVREAERVENALVREGVAVGVTQGVEVGEREEVVVLLAAPGEGVVALWPVLEARVERVAVGDWVAARAVPVAQVESVGLLVRLATISRVL